MAGNVFESAVLLAPGMEPAERPSHSYRNLSALDAGCSRIFTYALLLISISGSARLAEEFILELRATEGEAAGFASFTSSLTSSAVLAGTAAAVDSAYSGSCAMTSTANRTSKETR